MAARLLAVASAAAAPDTCDAGGPCLKLNTSVFIHEMSWYHYTRRVQAGATVLVPVGSTEQVRPLAPPSPCSGKVWRRDTHGWWAYHAGCALGWLPGRLRREHGAFLDPVTLA